MVEAVEKFDVGALPLPPKNPLPYWRRVAAVRSIRQGTGSCCRDAGGPVTQFVGMGLRWLMPPIVVTTSPQGGRDAIGRTDAFTDKTRAHAEMRHVLGNNLFDVMHDAWLPRRRAMQSIFTKQHVRDVRRADGRSGRGR